MMEAEPVEFKRLMIASSLVHVIIILTMLIVTTITHARRFLEPQGGKGPMNVIWATTVQSPRETKANKLPGPLVPPEPPPPSKMEPPKFVMPGDLAKNANQKSPEADAEARRKAMDEAV